MFSLQLYRFGRHAIKSYDRKLFSCSSKLNQNLDDRENQLRHIFRSIDPSSPFTNLIERLVSKPWIKFLGEKTKNITVKERKDTISKKNDSFRLAFDLPGYKQEEIEVILANNLAYIEAKKEEIGSDGSKSWREFSFECPIPKEVKSVNASIDSDGLLLIEADLPKETITGIKHESGKKSKRKKSD